VRFSLGRRGRALRIAYGRLFHEANAFSPLRTTCVDFERMHHVAGAELAERTTLRGVELERFMPHAELTGFRQAARLAGDVTAVPLQSSLAVPGGPLTREAWDVLSGTLLAQIADACPLDGLYLALHGSMQVEGLDEAPEAELLRRVRACVGHRVRLAVSYDLHANLTPGLVEPADIVVAYRSNPHWDLFPTGFRAGNRLVRLLRGEIHPVHAWHRLPMVLGGGATIAFLPPMRAVFRHMRRLEARPGVVSASLFMVHPYTSAERLGWAVHVSTDGDAAQAARLAEELAERVWAVRDVPPPPMRSATEALEEARRMRRRRLGPVTLVDVDDIVGAGAPGGNTRLVAALAREGRGLRAFVPVHDPRLVEELWSLSPGTRRTVVLRGTPGYGAPEVELDVQIGPRASGQFGRTLRLDSGRLHVVISEQPPLPIHPSFWRTLGLRARDADVIVQKNFFHYRMFYLTTSFAHLPVVSDGATSLERVRERAAAMGLHPGLRLGDWREPAGVRAAAPHEG